MEWLGLVKQELVEVAMLGVEQAWMAAWMAVLMLGEGVEQVVKKVPPSSSCNEAILGDLVILFFLLMDDLRGFPFRPLKDQFFALSGFLRR